jgi:hypothetical protein
MKYVIIIAGLLCSAGYSIYKGIQHGQESAITKYYSYSPSKGKEEVTFEYFKSVDSYRKDRFGSEVLFNTQAAYISGLSTFAMLLVFMGLTIITIYVIVWVRNKRKGI